MFKQMKPDETATGSVFTAANNAFDMERIRLSGTRSQERSNRNLPAAPLQNDQGTAGGMLHSPGLDWKLTRHFREEMYLTINNKNYLLEATLSSSLYGNNATSLLAQDYDTPVGYGGHQQTK